MRLNPILSAGLVSLGMSAVAFPALAVPQIASGDLWLEGIDQRGCLSRADRFISQLDIRSEQGDMDRTGFFNDGSFRILCYEAGASSVAVVFAAHEEDRSVAYDFVQYTLQQMGN